MFRKLLKTGMAGCLATATLCASFTLPANALPIAPKINSTAQNGLVTDAQVRFDFYFRGGRPYYNGHRGYRYRRPGWRRYNGWWFPPNAFGVYRPRRYAPPPRGLSRAHYRYCYNRYRSYRAYDNTFQPYHGRRRQCRSPYWP